VVCLRTWPGGTCQVVWHAESVAAAAIRAVHRKIERRFVINSMKSSFDKAIEFDEFAHETGYPLPKV